MTEAGVKDGGAICDDHQRHVEAQREHSPSKIQRSRRAIRFGSRSLLATPANVDANANHKSGHNGDRGGLIGQMLRRQSKLSDADLPSALAM